MRFKDEAKVLVKGGDGGSGSVHWRREKYIPRGGPDGGDGGTGGAVIFIADSGVNTLIDIAYSPRIFAQDGEAGEGARKNGSDGKDVFVKVPVGTQVFFKEELIADLSVPNSRWVAARGGVGGKGNSFFRTSTNQAPNFSQSGRKGENFEFQLVLKSVADVGLVGFPNVGKSTLISVISNAKPLIADYPFTTITPNLGVVELDSKRRFVIADIPGLIPEAHLGKGLGITFLKHIERTTVLAQIIDISTKKDGTKSSLTEDDEIEDQVLLDAVKEQFEIIENELANFSDDVLKLPRLVVFTKADLKNTTRAFELSKKWLIKKGYNPLIISSINKLGLEELKKELYQLIISLKKPGAEVE